MCVCAFLGEAAASSEAMLLEGKAAPLVMATFSPLPPSLRCQAAFITLVSLHPDTPPGPSSYHARSTHPSTRQAPPPLATTLGVNGGG